MVSMMASSHGQNSQLEQDSVLNTDSMISWPAPPQLKYASHAQDKKNCKMNLEIEVREDALVAFTLRKELRVTYIDCPMGNPRQQISENLGPSILEIYALDKRLLQ